MTPAPQRLSAEQSSVCLPAVAVPAASTTSATARGLAGRRGGQPRVVVLGGEVLAAACRERLLDELDVVAQLGYPCAPAEVAEVLAAHRPRMLLSTAALESLDSSIMRVCFEHRVQMLVLALPAYGLLGPARLHRFGGVPWLRLGWPDRRRAAALVKRAMDVTLVLAAAPVVVTVVLLICAVIGWSGPPFYVQDRVGEGGRTFRLVKLRTMRVDAERESGPVMAGPHDPRTTGVGRTLRRLRLDELPQLWNVLRGEMSLVGPRPERPEFIAGFHRLPHYGTRHLIRPGITGLAQLIGGYSATVEEKLRCDLLYMNCRSMRMDLKLLLLTLLDFARGFPRG